MDTGNSNLLSLNAGIEAARAGVHGKTFAVVAGEVKILADQSQKVAVNINKLLNTGLGLSNEASEKMTDLKGHIKNIVALITQISTSSQNQSHQANTINDAIQQIGIHVSSTANLAENLDTAIKSLSLDDN